MHVFLVWKRRYADVRAGTQAPPLRILLERIARGCPPLRFSLGGLRAGRLRMGQLVSFGKEIWPSTIFSCFAFPSTGKHDFAAPRNRLNHAPFGLEDGIDGREKHRKNGDIDAQHHQLIPKNGMQEGQNTRRKVPGNAIQRRPGDG